MLDTLLMLLNGAIPLAYLTLWAAHARAFFKPVEEPLPGALAVAISKAPLYGLLALHLLFTTLRGVAAQAWPMTNKAEFFSLLALSTFAVWLFSQREEQEAQTGIFFLGISASFSILAAALMTPADPLNHPVLLEHPVYGVHVLFTVLGFAALATGALEALMYILLSRQLKARELGLVFQKLPPLMSLEVMSRRATGAGIVLLGLGLALGYIVALYLPERFNPWDAKVVLTSVAWVAYLVGFFIVRLRGLGGLRLGYLSFAAFLLLMITMALSSLLFPSFHSFTA